MSRLPCGGIWIPCAAATLLVALRLRSWSWSNGPSFGDFYMEATNSTAGLSQSNRECAQTVGLWSADYNAVGRCATNSYTWCYWECSIRLEDTNLLTSTSMNSKPDGNTTRRSNYCMLPAFPCTPRHWKLFRDGVASLTQSWRMLFGPREPRVAMPAAPVPWTRWTEEAICVPPACNWSMTSTGKRPSVLCPYLLSARLKLQLHLSRILCAGRKLRRWRNKPQAHPRRKHRRRVRLTLNPNARCMKVCCLIWAGVHRLLLGRPLDDLCALVASTLLHLLKHCCQPVVQLNHAHYLHVPRLPQCLQILCSKTKGRLPGPSLPLHNPAEEPPEAERKSLPSTLSFRFIRVRPYLPSLCLKRRAALRLPDPGGTAWLIMDRDPLHDSVLAEAGESMEASDASSDTPMTRAERADATPLPAGPGPFGPPVPTPALLFTTSGPPAPLPYSQEVATQTTLRMLRTHGTASTGTSASGPPAPAAAHMGPLTGWQRDLALQIIERLHLTCPVYIHACSVPCRGLELG